LRIADETAAKGLKPIAGTTEREALLAERIRSKVFPEIERLLTPGGREKNAGYLTSDLEAYRDRHETWTARQWIDRYLEVHEHEARLRWAINDAVRPNEPPKTFVSTPESQYPHNFKQICELEDKSEPIASQSNANTVGHGDLYWVERTLYRTDNGAYFIRGRCGAAMSVRRFEWVTVDEARMFILEDASDQHDRRYSAEDADRMLAMATA
jgi:hypothetical protein